MIHLRQTLELASKLLSDNQIDFALIGGFALSAHGIHRATKDIDLLVDGERKAEIKKIFINGGFNVFHDSPELLQLEGFGYLDLLFANRPLSLNMLKQSKNGMKFAGIPVVSKEALIGLKIQAFKNDSTRELQDKADIQQLLKTEGINLEIVKEYADLFNAWSEIEELLK